MPDEKTTFRRLDASNLDGLADGLSALHHTVSGERRVAAHWRWRYLDAPVGPGGTVVALRGERVVGKLGNVHRRFMVAGQRAVVGLLEGLSVLPTSRSWRCYQGLAGMSYQESAADRLAFGYAFVNPETAELSRRTGAIDLGRVPVWVGFLSVRKALEGRGVPRGLSLVGLPFQPLVGLRRGNIGDAGVEMRHIERFGGACDELWDAVAPSRTVTAVRDAEYMNWRYVDHPEHRYERIGAYRGEGLDGLIVFRSEPSSPKAFILELLVRNHERDVFALLLLRAADMLSAQGAGLVYASFPAGSCEEAALKERGFRSWATRPWGMHLLISKYPGFGPRPQTPLLAFGDLPSPELDPANWCFSLGDWLIH